MIILFCGIVCCAIKLNWTYNSKSIAYRSGIGIEVTIREKGVYNDATTMSDQADGKEQLDPSIWGEALDSDPFPELEVIDAFSIFPGLVFNDNPDLDGILQRIAVLEGSPSLDANTVETMKRNALEARQIYAGLNPYAQASYSDYWISVQRASKNYRAAIAAKRGDEKAESYGSKQSERRLAEGVKSIDDFKNTSGNYPLAAVNTAQDMIGKRYSDLSILGDSMRSMMSLHDIQAEDSRRELIGGWITGTATAFAHGVKLATEIYPRDVVPVL